jgi:hypothetical protein
MRHRHQTSFSPYNDPEDRPFRMTEPALADLNGVDEMVEALQILRQGKAPIPLQRNRFFGGICLALPLSALLWYIIYHFVYRLAQ